MSYTKQDDILLNNFRTNYNLEYYIYSEEIATVYFEKYNRKLYRDIFDRATENPLCGIAYNLMNSEEEDLEAEFNRDFYPNEESILFFAFDACAGVVGVCEIEIDKEHNDLEGNLGLMININWICSFRESEYMCLTDNELSVKVYFHIIQISQLNKFSTVARFLTDSIIDYTLKLHPHYKFIILLGSPINGTIEQYANIGFKFYTKTLTYPEMMSFYYYEYDLELNYKLKYKDNNKAIMKFILNNTDNTLTTNYKSVAGNPIIIPKKYFYIWKVKYRNGLFLPL